MERAPWRSVEEAEALAFLAAYPRERLDSDVCGIVEPPMLGYYDFHQFRDADALVAACSLDDGMGAHEVRRVRWRIRG